jgi:peptidoglycan/LPS O-acetylase OafA/YrhL
MSIVGASIVPAQPAAANAYLYMDGARAVLAGVVAFGHAWALLIEDYRPTGNLLINAAYFAAGFGHPAVILFFVLSGYWIGRSVIQSSASGWSWRSYLGNRLTRLMPVLVPALLLGGALDAIGLAMGSATHFARTDTYVLLVSVAQTLTLMDFAGNLVFLQDILVAPFGSNGPLWSLAYEFWYYIWFPALWFAIRHRRLSFALAAFGLGALHPDLLVHFPVWLAGAGVVLAHRWCERHWLPTKRSRRILAIAAGTIFTLVLLWGRTGDYRGEDFALGAGFALLLLGWLLCPPRSFPGLRALGRFGRGASFSLYVTHFPVMALIAALALDGPRMVPDARGAAIAALAMLIAMVVALIFANFTEANTDRLRAWLHVRFARRQPGSANNIVREGSC